MLKGRIDKSELDEVTNQTQKFFKSLSIKKPKQTEKALFNLGGGFTTDKCLNREFDQEVIRLVSLVRWAEKTNSLPSPGGLLDQSNYFYEAREIVVGEEAVILDEIHKKSMAEAKSRPKSSPSIPKSVPRRGSMRRR